MLGNPNVLHSQRVASMHRLLEGCGKVGQGLWLLEGDNRMRGLHLEWTSVTRAESQCSVTYKLRTTERGI